VCSRPVMFVFCCDALHTVCLMCFSGYCQFQMNNKKFRVFDDVGYSIHCPGIDLCLVIDKSLLYLYTGPECANCPVRDPHHFYMVNAKFVSCPPEIYTSVTVYYCSTKSSNIKLSCVTSHQAATSSVSVTRRLMYLQHQLLKWR